MRLGTVIHQIENTHIFIVDIGWGQLRYFYSDQNYKAKDIILFDDGSYSGYMDNNALNMPDFDWIVWEIVESSKKDSIILDNEASETDEVSENESKINHSNKIYVLCGLSDCEFLGNVGYNYDFSKKQISNIIIARKDSFGYWAKESNDDSRSIGRMKKFDLASNTLLFLSHVEPRYPYPDENEFMKAYSYAKKKVEELDIPKMIEEIKVEYHTYSHTRRGSDNVLITSKDFRCVDYYDRMRYDSYISPIFPKYIEELYSSKDDECDYIHPKFENSTVIVKSDGSRILTESKFDGQDIEVYCKKKTEELRKQAWKNYESYNKEEHIIHLAYNHIKWWDITQENELIQRMKGLGRMIWGHNHQALLKELTEENYKDFIEKYNSMHPIPPLPLNLEVARHHTYN